jgi:drug/metabolite transporter (DMT)-like permease
VRDWLYIAVAILGWGTWIATSKLAVRNMSPMLVQLVMLYVYSALAPLAFLAMKWRNDVFVWTRPGIFWAVVTSCLGLMAIYAFMLALESKPASVVTSYTSTYPAVGFLLCWLALGEEMSLLKVVGAMLLVIGCVIMNL